MGDVSSKQAVNDVLRFPLAEEFEADLTALFDADPGDGNTVLAMADLDHFLLYNEQFGRDAGDRLLIEIGQYLRDHLPETAKIYRVGGDEFGMVFHGELEKEEVFLLLESIRSRAEFMTPEGEPVSLSFGIAAAFDDAARYQELVRKAESAMFRAKFGGRNKIALAREEKMVPKTSHYTADQLKRLTKLSKREGIGEAILLREALDILLKKYED